MTFMNGGLLLCFFGISLKQKVDIIKTLHNLETYTVRKG